MIKKLNPLLLMAMLLFISTTVFSAGRLGTKRRLSHCRYQGERTGAKRLVQ